MKYKSYYKVMSFRLTEAEKVVMNNITNDFVHNSNRITIKIQNNIQFYTIIVSLVSLMTSAFNQNKYNFCYLLNTIIVN